MNIINKFKNISIKWQLIIGITILNGVISIFFAADLVAKQKNIIEEHFVEEAEFMANNLSVSTAASLMSLDYAGLTEINKSFANYDETLYSFIYLPDGKVVSHSDQNYIGKFLTDKKSLDGLKKNKFTIIENNYSIIDMSAPIFMNKKIIGWARICLNKASHNSVIDGIIKKSIIYTLISIFLGFLFSFWIAKIITNQLQNLIDLAKKVEGGNHLVRAKVYSENEIGKLTQVFNSMLDTLNNEEIENFKAKQQLQKTEERIQLAIVGSQNGIWDYNVKTGEVFFSKRWPEMLGLEENELKPHVSEWIKRVHPDDLEKAELALRKHIDGETKFYECEHRLLHKNGTYIWTVGKGIGVKDEDGKITRVVGTQTDLTKRKEAELEKEKMFEQVRQSQKMEAIGHLTGGIAHDFNNILAGIIGFSDMGIKRGSQDEKTLGYFFHVSKLAKRAKDLVSQMLIYSRGGDPIPKVIDAVNVINDSLKLVLPMLSTDVNVSTDFHDIKPKIKIDPVQLQQILMNFVINSKDAAKGEGCEVKVEISRTNFIPDLCSSCGHKIAGNFIKLEISDNGTGISDVNLKKIFEPFFTTKEPGKGTGMGLAMVHGIMHRNHGHIVAKSILGKGTSFICYFPEVEHEVEEKTLTAIKNIPIYSEKKKVLIVDDEQFLRKFVAEFLEVEGYECFEAEDGNCAIDILKNNTFDLVITDYTMPGINGIQLIEKIKKSWPHLPVILSSGNIDLELEKNYKHLKIDGMLIKPYDIEDAVAVINNVVKAVIKQKIA